MDRLSGWLTAGAFAAVHDAHVGERQARGVHQCGAIGGLSFSGGRNRPRQLSGNACLPQLAEGL